MKTSLINFKKRSKKPLKAVKTRLINKKTIPFVLINTLRMVFFKKIET